MNSQFIAVLAALAVSGMVVTPVVYAGENSCDSIDWNPKILARFASINQACQEVVIRDGKKFARFEVKLIRAKLDGNVTVRMKLRNGGHVESNFFAPRDFHVLSNSGLTNFHMNELSPGDILDVYIPESRIESATLGDDSV